MDTPSAGRNDRRELVATDVERPFVAARGAGRGVPARPRFLRRVLAEGIAGFARLAGHVFFRAVGLTGIDEVPRGAPLVFVANHNNSVVDSLLLLALPGVRPRMLAKSTLFSHPVMGPLLFLAGALPVYRRRDQGADVKRNSETFSRCHEILATGGSIALFPEGSSHSLGRQLPLKTGAARIVLEAEARQGPLGVRVVPVGLRYDAKERFRSRVSVHVGRPIDPTAEVILYREGPHEAIHALTERIGAGLEEAALRATERSEEQGAGAAADQPRRSVMRLLALPVQILGYALNWLPYRLPGWVSDRLSTTPDEPATYKLLTGLLAFPLVWAVEAAIATRLAGPAWGLAVMVAAPASGYAALRLREAWNRH